MILALMVALLAATAVDGSIGQIHAEPPRYTVYDFGSPFNFNPFLDSMRNDFGFHDISLQALPNDTLSHDQLSQQLESASHNNKPFVVFDDVHRTHHLAMAVPVEPPAHLQLRPD